MSTQAKYFFTLVFPTNELHVDLFQITDQLIANIRNVKWKCATENRKFRVLEY